MKKWKFPIIVVFIIIFYSYNIYTNYIANVALIIFLISMLLHSIFQFSRILRRKFVNNGEIVEFERLPVPPGEEIDNHEILYRVSVRINTLSTKNIILESTLTHEPTIGSQVKILIDDKNINNSKILKSGESVLIIIQIICIINAIIIFSCQDDIKTATAALIRFIIGLWQH